MQVCRFGREFEIARCRSVENVAIPQRRGSEPAIKLVAVQSEIFRPVISRGESRIWNSRRQRNRIITATALSLGAALVTKDDKLLNYRHIKTIW